MADQPKLNMIKLKDSNNTVITTRLSEKEFMAKYNKRPGFIPMREFDYMSVVIHA